VVRGGDEHGVDSRIVEEPAVIGDGLRQPLEPVAELGADPVQDRRIDVAQGGDFRLRAVQQLAEKIFPPSPDADHGDPDRILARSPGGGVFESHQSGRHSGSVGTPGEELPSIPFAIQKLIEVHRPVVKAAETDHPFHSDYYTRKQGSPEGFPG
jgi:hypothetical protein